MVDDSDTDVYLVSIVSRSEVDSNDAELSSSSCDDNIYEANIANALQWVQLDVDNPDSKPPRFPFLAIPGKNFNLILPDDRLEYMQQFLDEVITPVVNEKSLKTAEKLKCSSPSEHSRFKKWVQVTKEEMCMFLALLLLQGIVHKPQQQWYWSKNKLLTRIFGEVMPCNWFLLMT
ncbi:hypothetical protein HPB49_013827 [Dermacentor silvarum]|uniref:Uncharacterized protein n=1 Tax=Dermacentor silvarum TaxID=543639 RepID=A0ACB8DPC7_DERSI|nr:hypothetical protein HPB49_013827 [Dermacentor silvarum]